jgi:hypothetical protein
MSRDWIDQHAAGSVLPRTLTQQSSAGRDGSSKLLSRTKVWNSKARQKAIKSVDFTS